MAADYVRMMGRDQFLNPNLNIGTRINTTRTGRINFLDPYGILNRVWRREKTRTSRSCA